MNLAAAHVRLERAGQNEATLLQGERGGATAKMRTVSIWPVQHHPPNGSWLDLQLPSSGQLVRPALNQATRSNTATVSR